MERVKNRIEPLLQIYELFLENSKDVDSKNLVVLALVTLVVSGGVFFVLAAEENGEEPEAPVNVSNLTDQHDLDSGYNYSETIETCREANGSVENYSDGNGVEYVYCKM